VHEVRIEQIDLGNDLPEQILIANEVCSHPEINRKPTTIALFPSDDPKPTAKIVLRFDDPAAQHSLAVNLDGVSIGGMAETGESLPVDISDGTADINIDGQFSADALSLPFTVFLRNLKADVDEGRTVLGMDSATATEVLRSMEQLEIDGSLSGSILSPRVSVDLEKLTASMKKALVAAGKKELANRANAEMDKAKSDLKQQAGEEVGKLLGGEEESVKDSAKNALKKLF